LLQPTPHWSSFSSEVQGIVGGQLVKSYVLDSEFVDSRRVPAEHVRLYRDW
jgi:hypothetical protein